MVEEAHKNIYSKSTTTDYHICYHYFIGTDGTTVNIRGLDERPYCTRDMKKNLSSIHVVLAGDTNINPPSSKQLASLKGILVNLNSVYNLKQIIGHKQANSPTQCPGDHLSDWLKGININPPEVHESAPEKKYVLSRYYTPVRDQPDYYRNYEGRQLFTKALEHNVIQYQNGEFLYTGEIIPVRLGNDIQATKMLSGNTALKQIIKSETEYLAEFKVNCLGSCFSPADGGRLYTDDDAYKSVACPKKYPLGTQFIINGQRMWCRDRGGAIIENGSIIRLDIYGGVGISGLNRIRNTPVPENPEVVVVLPQ